MRTGSLDVGCTKKRKDAFTSSTREKVVRGRVDRSLKAMEDRSTRFKRCGGILYLREVFDRSRFERIVLPEAGKLRRGRLRPELNSKALGRVGCYLPSNSSLHRLVCGPSLVERLRATLGCRSLIPSDYPTEYRLYAPGSMMEWHRDESMYVEPQIECVYTITNTSDSRTEWIDPEGRLHSQWMEPNSLLLVLAESAEHRVSVVRKGERSILKFVYCTSLERTPAFDENLLRAYE